jgi:hypothetical protein
MQPWEQLVFKVTQVLLDLDPQVQQVLLVLQVPLEHKGFQVLLQISAEQVQQVLLAQMGRLVQVPPEQLER